MNLIEATENELLFAAWFKDRSTWRAWLAFLDSRCPSAGLTRWMVLVEGAYRPRCQLDDKALQALHQAIDLWIRKHV